MSRPAASVSLRSGSRISWRQRGAILLVAAATDRRIKTSEIAGKLAPYDPPDRVPRGALISTSAICAIVTVPPVALRMTKEFVARFRDLPTDQTWHMQKQENNARPSCIYFS